MSGIRIPGLDMMLGGPLAVVPRAGEGKDNTTILVRGGPGVGKTVFATHLATQLAQHWKADVVYACVELLPTELAAQHEGIHSNHPPADVRIVPWPVRSEGHPRPQIFASMLDLGDRLDPEQTRKRFELGVVELHEAATRVSPRVRVLVVDSLSDGYGLGGTQAPRWLADSLCKYAAETGTSLVLIEETTGPAPSVWSFAVDLVLEIGTEPMPSGCRALRVTKNRFGPWIGGDAELHVAVGGITLMPPLAAYFDERNTLPEVALPKNLSWGIDALDRLKKLTPFSAPVCVFVEAALGHEFVTRLGGLGNRAGMDVEINYLGSTRPYARERPGSVVLAHGGPFVTPESVLNALLAWLRDAHARGLAVRKILHRLLPKKWLPPGFAVSDARATEHALAQVAVRMGIPLVCTGTAPAGPSPIYRVYLSAHEDGVAVLDHDRGVDTAVELAFLDDLDAHR
ncbi:MAG: hypothetical protein HY908_09895 [Myxococcales bacterium]|nr:hypothetical protein [Myxococcales bacterium]